MSAVHIASLWDDNPSEIDLLGFHTVAAPILAAVNAPDLDPITIGIHGPWGGGKSTVLKLIDESLRADSRYVLVSTNPWEYEDHDDVKGTVIAAVLDALDDRASGEQPWAKQARERVTSLAKRVSWSRVGAAVAKGAVTMAWNPAELLEAFSLRPEEPRSLVGFREEFAKLVADLEGVERVVVLVDDLDRCLPTAVVQSLEAIKLFLSVKRMVFVIGADQELVRDAIAAYLPPSNRTERIAQNYLGKLIQIPVLLPRLPAHDAEAYIGLLLASLEGEQEDIVALAEHCNNRPSPTSWETRACSTSAAARSSRCGWPMLSVVPLRWQQAIRLYSRLVQFRIDAPEDERVNLGEMTATLGTRGG